MLILKNILLQILLNYDQFDYFLEHASSNTEILIGSVGFVVIFIILPLVVEGLLLFALIKIALRIGNRIHDALTKCKRKE